MQAVKGQQAEGQQEKSKAAPQLAAVATTWSNPMLAYSTAPPSFCGSAQASSLVPGDQAEPEAHSQTGPGPHEPARQPLSTAAAEPDKSTPVADTPIRQMQLSGTAASCASFFSEQESVLPTVADPADALQRSADTVQASSVPAGTLSSSELNMPSQSTHGASSADQAALLVAEPLSAENPAACFAETADMAMSGVLEPSGTHQDNDDVRCSSPTFDCEQPDLAGAVVQKAQAGVSGTDQAQGAAETTSTDEPRAAAAALTGQTPFVSATKEHQHSPAAAAAAAAAGGLVMSASAGSPVTASPSAASDASHAELYAMLDAALLDSPSPSAGSFTSAASAVRRRDVSPVPFRSLSGSDDADEVSARAAA